MLEASVIICTHNPRPEYLRRVVDALQSQTLSPERWELLVVDNASLDPVEKICDLSWHSQARHLVESRLGLSSARQCGIENSSGEILIFVDDDNVLESDYVERALNISRDWPWLGVWGSGSIDAEFESEPADHVKFLLPWLAVRHVNQPVWSNVKSCTASTPFGAGLCLRRKVAKLYVDHCRTTKMAISGRKGTTLGAHEDFEICFLACDAGFGMAIFPELKLLHLISRGRVTESHLVRLVEGVTYSQYVLENKWNGTVPRSPFNIRGFATFVFNLVSRRGFDRRVYFAELRALVGARRLLAGSGRSGPNQAMQ